MDLPAPSGIVKYSRGLFLPLVIFAEVFGVAAVILIGLWTGYFSTPGFQWSLIGKMNLHPFIMTLGMIFIFGNATLAYRVLGRLGLPRVAIKRIHGSMMLIVICCTGLGIYLMVTSILGKTFKNIHAMMGITTTVLFVLQFLFALGIFAFPCAPEWMRRTYMQVHAFFGILTLAMASATCLTGIQAGQSLYTGSSMVYLPAGFLIAAFSTTIAYILTKDLYRVRKVECINGNLPIKS